MLKVTFKPCYLGKGCKRECVIVVEAHVVKCNGANAHPFITVMCTQIAHKVFPLPQITCI